MHYATTPISRVLFVFSVFQLIEFPDYQVPDNRGPTVTSRSRVVKLLVTFKVVVSYHNLWYLMVLYGLTPCDLIKNGNYQVIHNTHIASHHVYHFQFSSINYR